MKAYLDIVKSVLDNGQWKNTRPGIKALTLPNQIFSHNMVKGFPLLTTKKMPIITIAVELEGFIKGITDKQWYQDRGCHIWDEWANPKIVKRELTKTSEAGFKEWNINNNDAHKKIQKIITDLGPFYGYQMRRFNQVYDEDDDGCLTKYDQLKTVVDTLHNNPNDRRMVVSYWNPCQMSQMALPPCCYTWGVVHIDNILNLYFTSRSCDFLIGGAWNIASYALLLLLLCKEANMKPGNLTGLLADCHIYENHIEAAKLQLTREPKPLPSVYIGEMTWLDIFHWHYKDILLENYQHHPKIEMSVAV